MCLKTEASLAIAAALAISGCTYALVSYLRDSYKPPSSSSSSSDHSLSKPINPCIRQNTSLVSSPKRSGKVRKHVRFAGVEEKKPRERKSKCVERKRRRVGLPENWRRLYTGINRYRSQQATLLLYA